MTIEKEIIIITTERTRTLPKELFTSDKIKHEKEFEP